MKAKDITGQKFGRLTAIKLHHKKLYNSYWLFKCDCGKKHVARKANVLRGAIKSCGCLSSEVSRKKATKHGFAGSPFYVKWTSLYCRCNLKTHPHFANYGGRGIKIHWKNFIEFKRDMYKSYLNHIKEFGRKNTTLDRIDNNKGYSKDNCRWATLIDQARNTRRNSYVLMNGRMLVKAEAAEKIGLNPNSFNSRLSLGYELDELTKPKGYRKRVFYQRKIIKNNESKRELTLKIMKEFQKSVSRTRMLLSVLNDRERQIVTLRFGLQDGKKHTLQEVANILVGNHGKNLTRERVRQIEDVALSKILEAEKELSR